MAVQLLDEGQQITVRDSELQDVDGGDPETTYTVRQISPEVGRRINKAHTTSTTNRRTGSRESIVDHDAILEDALDYALIAWSGIVHNNQPVPCERQYKALLDFPRKSALLRLAWVNQVADDKEASFRSPARIL